MVEQLKPQYSVVWIDKMSEIPQQKWDALAQPLTTPFLEWEWLHNIETSGSATGRTGWQPSHLTVWCGAELIAAAPLYIKSHSYGEFVFDHQWADLSHRLGIRYYPKLLGMTPFTPAVGYRFLIAPGENELEITALMIAAIDHFCDQNNLSGCHFLFVDPQWRILMENFGFTPWLHHSYIWNNKGFQSFEDYLTVFNANQRRNIKRERKAVTNAGLIIKTLAAEEIPHHLFPLIYRFYSSTCDKFYWGSKYLTQKFFEQLYPNYRQRVVLITAYKMKRILNRWVYLFVFAKILIFMVVTGAVFKSMTVYILKLVTINRSIGQLVKVLPCLTPVREDNIKKDGVFPLLLITVYTVFIMAK